MAEHRSAESWIRLSPMHASIALSILFLGLGFVLSAHFWWPLIVLLPFAVWGLYDFFQKKHSLLRNYPILGRMRFLLETLGPAIYQYMIESNQAGRPFSRDWRALMYQRAKGIEAKKVSLLSIHPS